MEAKLLVTDGWVGCRRSIPLDPSFTGDDFIVSAEQDHSQFPCYRTHARQKTTVISKCKTVVNLSMLLRYKLHDVANNASYASYASYASVYCLSSVESPVS